ncbi:unnamed protein product [Durusdinium trenchii]|uniref:Uncharacterized protein n=2 Tax=Durusdinium trenchii TaxID=1381693 RepID=A0ABP0PCA1_9DINO
MPLVPSQPGWMSPSSHRDILRVTWSPCLFPTPLAMQAQRCLWARATGGRWSGFRTGASRVHVCHYEKDEQCRLLIHTPPVIQYPNFINQEHPLFERMSSVAFS